MTRAMHTTPRVEHTPKHIGTLVCRYRLKTDQRGRPALLLFEPGVLDGVAVALKGKIRALREREGKSIIEIAKRTSLSRNTIKKWLKVPADAQLQYQRRSAPCKLTPFFETIRQALKTDAHRPRHERRSARALLSLIQARRSDVDYSRRTDFIRAWPFYHSHN